ncbi:MAG: hypothetical protein GX591_02020 [Planctomycetes bacterium]|nr:hypothetical protein [Planctomycetota bacterium]
MQLLKTFGCSVIAFGILMTVAAAASAQDADADTAKALLSQGMKLFEAMEYDEAHTTLVKIDPSQLPDDEARSQLETAINNVDVAMVQQGAARDAFARARDLLNKGQFAEAEALFARVIASEYVPGPMKKDAQVLMTVAVAKRQRQQSLAAQAAPPAAAPSPAAAPADDAVVAAPAVAEGGNTGAEAELREAAAGAEAAGDTRAAEAMATAAPRQAEEQAPVVEAPATEAPAAEAPAGEPAPAVETAVEPEPAQDVQPAVEPEAQRRLVAAEAARLRAEADARQLVDQGLMALEVNNAAAAAGKFREALKLVPDMAEAQQGLDQATALLERTPQGSLPTLIRNRQIALQKAQVDFDKALGEARQLLDTARDDESFRAAGDRTDYAISILESNRQLFPAGDYTARRSVAQGLGARIDEEYDRWQRAEVRRKLDDATRSADDYRRDQDDQRQAKIETLMDRAQALAREQNWDQAIETAQEILRLDAHHVWAAAKVEAWRQFSQVQEQARSYDKRLDQEMKHIVALEGDMTPWYDLLRYPQNWDEITRRRSITGSEHDLPADRETRQKLDELQDTVEFDELEFEAVITYLRSVTEANFSVNWVALSGAGVDRDTPVTLILNNVTAAKALDEILDSLGGVVPLAYIISGGVVRISTEEELASIVDTRVYQISDLLVSVPDFVGPSLRISRQEASGDSGGSSSDSGFGGGGGDGGIGGGGFGTGGAGGQPLQERQAMIDEILTTVRASIAPETWIENGAGGAASIRELNGQVIVTQTPANHKRLEDLFNQLREAQAVAVNVEYRTITVSTGFLNDVGLSLDFFLNIGSETTQTGIDPITGARILGSGAPALPQWANGSTWSNRLTPMVASQRSFDFTGFPSTEVPNAIGALAQTATSGLGAMFLQGSFLDDIQVDFLVRATQADQRSTSFIAPRLSLRDGQRAFMMIGTEQAYVSDLETVTNENVFGYEVTVSTVTTGQVLDVQAIVSHDRRYVTLTLRPTSARVLDFFEYAVEETTTEASQSRSGVVQLPLISINQVSTTVTVPDGGTLLIAGERRAGEVTREMGVPILNKIPIINRLFSNRSMSRDEVITLLLVKPTIIINREYEEDLYPR